MRAVIAVIGGYVTWTGVWIGGNLALQRAGLMAEGREKTEGGLTGHLALLGMSMLASVLAGIVIGWLGGRRRIALIGGSLLLATGIWVQWSNRSMFPLWFHLLFLALVVPFVLVGQRMIRRE